MRINCLLLVFILIWSTSMSQDHLIESPTTIDSTSSLKINLYALSFTKNNEYKNDFTRGFTGIGYILRPGVQISLSDKFKFSAGVWLRQFSGLEILEEPQLHFRMEYQLPNGFLLVLGNLYGTFSHGLEEPLYRFDRLYLEPVENGIQLLKTGSILKSDTWLHWENYLKGGEDEQEIFHFGSVNSLTLFDNDVKLVLPIQLLVSHRGGEIDVSDEQVRTVLNASLGFNLSKRINKWTLSLVPSYLIYRGVQVPVTGINKLPFENGSAYHLTLKLESPELLISTSYWNANKFISPRGEFLYQSISDYNPNFNILDRELWMTNIRYQHEIYNGINLSLRWSSYYDLIDKDLAHNLGLFLSINQNFFLGETL